MEFILEYKTFALLPRELRNKNLLYHSTDMDSFEKILKDNKIYGSIMYDTGIATSRNKHYAFGFDDDSEMHNKGDVQFILDRDKIKNVCKIKAFDWENMKSSEPKTGEYNHHHQSEDKILCKNNTLTNVSKYIVGIHVVKDKYLEDVLNNELVKKEWYIFSEDWELIRK